MPNEQALPTEQANTQRTPAEAAVAANQEVSQDSPFFEYVDPTGEKEVFKTREDLMKDWRRSRLQQADYTRKTQEIAQTRKQFEAEQKKFQEEQKAFLENRKRYDTWDEKLKMRPDVMRMLEQYLEQPENPANAFERARGYVDENTQKLQEKLEAIEKKMAEADSKREIEEAFIQLKNRFPDADEAAVMERLEAISDGKLGPLLEQLYYSHKGQTSPAQVEKTVFENLKKKEGAGMVPAGSSRKAPSPTFKNLDEARNAAMAAEGLMGG